MNSNVDAERSVLGAMFRSNAAVTTATERLQVDDFYAPEHRAIFAVMLELALSGKKIDLVTVDERLTGRGKLDAIGGAEYLIDLTQSVPSAANVDAYIDIVVEKANIRRLQAIAEAINRRVDSGETQSDRIIELIEGACNDITQRTQQRDAGWISGSDAAIQAYESAESNYRPIPTGFVELDNLMCGGLSKPELTIVGARPGKGKSAFLLTASMSAVRAGYHVGYFSLEMSALQIGQRELASTSYVGLTKQRKGKEALTDKDWESLSTGLVVLEDQGAGKFMHIYQSYGLTIERLCNIARHAVQRGEMDMLVVDYIQLLKTVEKTRSDFERLGIVSKNLKQLALSLDIPILTAAQVRRQSQDDSKKGGRAPTLDELRGSGDLEQDADNVLLIHTPSDPNDPTLAHLEPEHVGIWERSRNAFANPFSVEVAKQRQGATGRTWCLFKPSNMRFYEDKTGGQK